MSNISGNMHSILPEIQAFQNQMDLDMKNAGLTSSDLTKWDSSNYVINSLLSTPSDDANAYDLNDFIKTISGTNPFQNLDSVLDQLKLSNGSQTGLGKSSASHVTVAPTLAIPTDPGMMQIWLSQLIGENSEVQLQGDQSSINEMGAIQTDVNKKALSQFDKAQQDIQNALDAQKNTNVSAWCSSVFEMIGASLGMAGAVMAAIATGGAATPLVVAASVGLLMAMDNFTNQALQQAGVQVEGPNGQSQPIDITLGGMVKAIVQQEVKDGMIAVAPQHAKPGGITFSSQEQLNEYISGWSAAASLIVALGLLAVGGVEGASTAVTASTRIVGVASATSDAGSAGAAAGQGANQIDVAKFQSSADEKTAEQKMLNAISDYLASYIKSQSEDAKSKLKLITAVQKSASDTIKNISDTLIAVSQQNA